MKNKTLFMLIKHFCTVSFIFSLSYRRVEAVCDESKWCDPSECCNLEGDLVPDPLDCFKYYLCIKDADDVIMPSDQSIDCPIGQFFNTESFQCEIGVDCLIPCANRNCRTVCTGDFQTLANPNDCSKYYVCIPGQYDNPTPTNCSDPTLPYFDGTTCTDNQYKCCDLCTPFCPEANMEVLDPYDCKAYYLCTAADTKPSDNYKFNCTAGNYFDPASGVCQIDDGDPCKPLCEKTSFRKHCV